MNCEPAWTKILSKVQFSKVFLGFSSGLCHTHLISFIVPERRVRSDNYFALERLQKQSLWRRKKDGKSAKNFPSSPSCPLSEFCSSDRFYSGTVSNNYFLAREKTKRNLPNLEVSDECSKSQSSSALPSLQYGGYHLSCV